MNATTHANGSPPMPAAPPPALFDVPGVCAYLSLSRATIMRLVRAGEIRAIRIGRAIRVSRVALDAFIASKQG